MGDSLKSLIIQSAVQILFHTEYEKYEKQYKAKLVSRHGW